MAVTMVPKAPCILQSNGGKQNAIQKCIFAQQLREARIIASGHFVLQNAT